MPELSALRLVDLVLAVGVAELLALLALRRPALVLTLLAGLTLMLALRLAVAGMPPIWMALALLASGLLHAIDLHRRWPARPPGQTAASAPVPPHERTT
jgi:hypothetical protein